MKAAQPQGGVDLVSCEHLAGNEGKSQEAEELFSPWAERWRETLIQAHSLTVC